MSHLHFDHLGGIVPFEHVAMIDLPETRADVSGAFFKPKPIRIHGHASTVVPLRRFASPSGWRRARSLILAGGRCSFVHPGHTPTSVALFDAQNRRLFIGDFIYPTTLYAFFRVRACRLIKRRRKCCSAMLPADTVLWTAHCCRKNEGVSAPWLSMRDLRDLDVALTAVRAGRGEGAGFYPRVFPVNDEMTLAAGFPWNNR